jgi:hypothetical protein
MIAGRDIGQFLLKRIRATSPIPDVPPVMTTARRLALERDRVPGGHAYTRTIHTDASGRAILEHWDIHGLTLW